jgi:tetratricopeptide (TPR) repeat protein
MGQAGDFCEAVEELQRGRNLLRGANSLKLCLQLSNGLAEIYCQAALFQACVLLCEHTLTVWGHSPHHFELLQTLFYLSHAHYWLNQDHQGNAAVDEWTEKLTAETVDSKCILLFTLANKHRRQGEYEVAQQLYEDALLVTCPPSYISASCRRYLADVYEFLGQITKAEAMYLCAAELLSVNWPKSYSALFCKYRLSTFYMDRHRLQDAEAQLLIAKQHSLHYFPYTEMHAECLGLLGKLYETMNRQEDAKELHLQAVRFCSDCFLHSDTYARCLDRLGDYYSRTEKKLFLAEQQYLRACLSLSTISDASQEWGWCLYDLRNMYV